MFLASGRTVSYRSAQKIAPSEIGAFRFPHPLGKAELLGALIGVVVKLLPG